MIDRSHTEAVTYRVAVTAITYHPDKPTTDPGYTLDEDVDWCLEPLAGLPPETLTSVRAVVAETVVDPTAHRQTLQRRLDDLISDGGEARS